jgi:hypothetical protein
MAINGTGGAFLTSSCAKETSFAFSFVRKKTLTEWRRNSPPFMAEIQGVFHYFYSYVTYNMI